MQASVVKIGSSVGVIIPNSIVKEASLQTGKKLDLRLTGKSEIILTKSNPREGWDLAAQELHSEQGDQLLMPDIFEDENVDEWKL
jgi:antitoxin MazE